MGPACAPYGEMLDARAIMIVLVLLAARFLLL